MNVAVLFAGGKDSTYAAHEAVSSGLKIKYLLTIISKNPHSWMFHTINIKTTRYQADAMGFEQYVRTSSGEKERELEDLKQTIAAVRTNIGGIVSGGIASSYQKSRIDGICKDLGLESITPLWGRDPHELLHDMRMAGFKIMITRVAAQGFNQSWLGREIDESAIDDLNRISRKYGINPIGEGGEYESFVLDAPLFKKSIVPIEVETVWKGTNGDLLIKRVKMAKK